MEMERILESHEAATEKLREELILFQASYKDYQKLMDYYGSDRFMEDINASYRGEIPEEISARVLSEDAVFDLISENFDMGIFLLELATVLLKDK